MFFENYIQNKRLREDAIAHHYHFKHEGKGGMYKLIISLVTTQWHTHIFSGVLTCAENISNKLEWISLQTVTLTLLIIKFLSKLARQICQWFMHLWEYIKVLSLRTFLYIRFLLVSRKSICVIPTTWTVESDLGQALVNVCHRRFYWYSEFKK